MTRAQEDPPPASGWLSSILRRTKSATDPPPQNSDSASKTELEFSSSSDSEPTPCSPGRSSKTRAKTRLTRPLSSRSIVAKADEISVKKTLKTKLAKASVKSKACAPPVVPSMDMDTTSSPTSTPSAADIRIAELERELSSVRAQLLTKDAEFSSYLAKLTASVTESVTKSLEEKFFSRLNSVSTSVADLEKVLLRPSVSYADMSSSDSAPAAAPKRLKTERNSMDSMMDVPILNRRLRLSCLVLLLLSARTVSTAALRLKRDYASSTSMALTLVTVSR